MHSAEDPHIYHVSLRRRMTHPYDSQSAGLRPSTNIDPVQLDVWNCSPPDSPSTISLRCDTGVRESLQGGDVQDSLRGSLQRRNFNLLLLMTESIPGVTFFHLPHELRDLIYDHALGPNQRCFRYGRLGFLVSPVGLELTSPTLNGLPTWLLTSRTICNETVALISRTQMYSPSTTTHQCKPPLPLKPRCIAPWHPPRLTGRQRARMKLEERQHQVCEFEKQLVDAPPKPRRTNPTRAAPKSAPILSCSTVSQSLLLHTGNIRHIALNVPANLTFERSAAYAYDITIINDTRPWCEFLETVNPFSHLSNLHLTLTWDAKEPQHLEPYFDWPEKWLGRFAYVDVALLATEADCGDMKERIESVVNNLFGAPHKYRKPAVWSPEPVYEEATMPPCEVHGEFCTHIYLQQPRLSGVIRHTVSMFKLRWASASLQRAALPVACLGK